MSAPLDIVIFGLSLSSSWGNGHATTYRALLRGLAAGGHRVLFLERDVPWYASNRDLPEPDFCDFALYDGLDDLDRWQDRIARADAVIIGSYVPDSVALLDRLAESVRGRLVYYDIDTPVTLAALESDGAEYIRRRQLPLIDLYLSFAGGAALDRLRDLGARKVAPLYCSVDPERYRPEDVEEKWDLGYLGTYSPDRQPGLEELLIEPARRLPECRFVVAGSQFPDDVDWPFNVERLEHVAPPDHAAFYNAQRFTLNLTRSAMRKIGHSPSVRLFEAAACGTAIISDPWPGIEEVLVPEKAILLADRTETVVTALSMSESRRKALAKAARDSVLADHTGQARARYLASQLGALPATSGVPA
ncbi:MULTISPECIES: CgeB family protein [Actibacterium]|uniref:Spore maturation protein CgeB n=1 Tax=Actibacterium naphthalenivorans TaxID=1614693 RepID=A0A840CAW4_9RHOB|nr:MULTISPECIES: glycosyltransferase [Actibacterium]ALG89213.1 glycosyltransferase [Actibacterium sp. EMB200-NS6]MBB4021202.1 spore maturation protein CgeB [Actibacterium naphthalenivorans]